MHWRRKRRLLGFQWLPGAIATQIVPACAETWAITDRGLYRLLPSDAGVGHWVSEPLDAGDDPNFGPDAMAGAKLIAFSGQIYLFNPWGGVLTFTPQAGCR